MINPIDGPDTEHAKLIKRLAQVLWKVDVLLRAMSWPTVRGDSTTFAVCPVCGRVDYAGHGKGCTYEDTQNQMAEVSMLAGDWLRARGIEVEE